MLSEQKRNKTAFHSVPKTQQVYGNPYNSSKKHDPHFIFDSVHTDLQVPSLAPVIKAVPKRYSLFFVYGGQGKSAVGISHKMRVSVDSVCGGLWLFSIRLCSVREKYHKHYFGNWSKVGAKRNYLLLILTDCKKSGRIITEKSYIFQQRKGWQK